MKIAIVGLGMMGMNHYNILKDMDVDLVAVDVDESVTEKVDCKVYADLHTMNVNEDGIDCAVISVPTTFHSEVATTCLGMGLDIFIEKPLTKTLSEAMELSMLNLGSKGKIAVGHIERFNPAIRTLLDDIKDDTIISCDIKRVSPYPHRINDVGVSLDLLVHDIDLVRFITKQEIHSFNSVSKTINGSYEDYVQAYIKTVDGVVSSLTASWLSPFRERMVRLLTDKAYYEVDLMNPSVDKYTSVDNSSYNKKSLFIKRENALQKELSEFINYVKYGQLENLATIEDGIKIQKLIELVK